MTKEKQYHKIRPHMVANLMTPTPRTYSESHLYYEEKLDKRFPPLPPSSFLKKPRVKLRERARFAFEEILIQIAKKLKGNN